VLSRELELRFAPGKARAGQLVSGPFDVRFKRVK
jgi:hypothetical protein